MNSTFEPMPHSPRRRFNILLTAAKTCSLALLLWMGTTIGWSQEAKPPVNIAIVGLTHDHAYGFIPRMRNRPELQLAGIVESNADLVARYTVLLRQACATRRLVIFA